MNTIIVSTLQVSKLRPSEVKYDRDKWDRTYAFPCPSTPCVPNFIGDTVQNVLIYHYVWLLSRIYTLRTGTTSHILLNSHISKQSILHRVSTQHLCMSWTNEKAMMDEEACCAISSITQDRVVGDLGRHGSIHHSPLNNSK